MDAHRHGWDLHGQLAVKNSAVAGGVLLLLVALFLGSRAIIDDAPHAQDSRSTEEPSNADLVLEAAADAREHGGGAIFTVSASDGTDLSGGTVEWYTGTASGKEVLTGTEFSFEVPRQLALIVLSPKEGVSSRVLVEQVSQDRRVVLEASCEVLVSHEREGGTGEYPGVVVLPVVRSAHHAHTASAVLVRELEDLERHFKEATSVLGSNAEPQARRAALDDLVTRLGGPGTADAQLLGKVLALSLDYREVAEKGSAGASLLIGGVPAGLDFQVALVHDHPGAWIEPSAGPGRATHSSVLSLGPGEQVRVSVHTLNYSLWGVLAVPSGGNPDVRLRVSRNVREAAGRTLIQIDAEKVRLYDDFSFEVVGLEPGGYVVSAAWSEGRNHYLALGQAEVVNPGGTDLGALVVAGSRVEVTFSCMLDGETADLTDVVDVNAQCREGVYVRYRASFEDLKAGTARGYSQHLPVDPRVGCVLHGLFDGRWSFSHEEMMSSIFEQAGYVLDDGLNSQTVELAQGSLARVDIRYQLSRKE